MKQDYLKKIVLAGLAEDIDRGDTTTNNLISSQAIVQVHVVFKSPGIVCGLNVAEHVFKALSKKVSFKRLVKEGAKVS